MIKILNTIHEDYHIHSLNYSDGMNTIDEIVQYAGKIGLKKIVMTDHSQVVIEKNKLGKKNPRSLTKRRINVHNNVEVIFGIEADILDEVGNCCFDIQGIEPDFCILSCHRGIYEGKFENITQAYINAIHKYNDKIKCIGHICKKNTSKYLDVDMVAKVLNQYQIPIELNCCNLYTDKTDKEKLNRILPMVEAGIYINSDMHTLHELDIKKIGFDYLQGNNLI